MLDPHIKELANGVNFAALTTLLPDGAPMTHVMWVSADDEHVLINTEVDRQKYKNVQRDPRVAVTIVDRSNPYHYAEVRGRVVDTVTGEEARRDIDALSNKYNGKDYPPENIGSERVLLKITPERQRVFGR